MFHTVSPSHLRGAVGHRQYDGGQRRLGALCGRGELHSDGQCGAEETGLLAACPTKNIYESMASMVTVLRYIYIYIYILWLDHHMFSGKFWNMTGDFSREISIGTSGDFRSGDNMDMMGHHGDNHLVMSLLGSRHQDISTYPNIGYRLG